MATNLNLDDALINKARDAGGHKSKREAVTAALQEYVRRKEMVKILELRGKIDYWPDYDHKALRRRKIR